MRCEATLYAQGCDATLYGSRITGGPTLRECGLGEQYSMSKVEREDSGIVGRVTFTCAIQHVCAMPPFYFVTSDGKCCRLCSACTTLVNSAEPRDDLNADDEGTDCCVQREGGELRRSVAVGCSALAHTRAQGMVLAERLACRHRRERTDQGREVSVGVSNFSPAKTVVMKREN